MPKIPPVCPLCGGKLTVTAVQCQSCGTTFQGHFDSPPSTSAFDRLNAEQLHFLEVFIRNEGKFSRMEKAMGLSYPTLRNRLRTIIRAMGYNPEEDEPRPLTPAERQRILDDLEAGKISAAEAARLLQGKAE
jgi:hypothetical protein